MLPPANTALPLQTDQETWMGSSSPPKARRTRHAPTTMTAPFHFSSAAG
jgi:hypothetical protein